MLHPFDQLKPIQTAKKDDSAEQLISMAVLFAGLFMLLRKPESESANKAANPVKNQIKSPIEKEIIDAAKDAAQESAPSDPFSEFDNDLILSKQEQFKFSVPPKDASDENISEFYDSGLGEIELSLWSDAIEKEKSAILKKLETEFDDELEKENDILQDAEKRFLEIFPNGYTNLRRGSGMVSHYFIVPDSSQSNEIKFRISNHSPIYDHTHDFRYKSRNLASLSKAVESMIETAHSIKAKRKYKSNPRSKTLKIGGSEVEAILMAGGNGAKVYSADGKLILTVGRKNIEILEDDPRYKKIMKFVNLKYQPAVEKDQILSDFSSTIEELKASNPIPPASVAREAREGLELRAGVAPSKRGGTTVGLARARQLANRQNVSKKTMKRMDSFFARHEVDKKATGFRRGEKGFPSKGVQAWKLWGGDSAKKWLKKFKA